MADMAIGGAAVVGARSGAAHASRVIGRASFLARAADAGLGAIARADARFRGEGRSCIIGADGRGADVRAFVAF